MDKSKIDWSKQFDCFDYGCGGECEVCKYLDWIDWAESVGKPEGSVIQRNNKIETYLKLKAEANDRPPRTPLL